MIKLAFIVAIVVIIIKLVLILINLITRFIGFIAGFVCVTSYGASDAIESGISRMDNSEVVVTGKNQIKNKTSVLSAFISGFREGANVQEEKKASVPAAVGF